MEEILFHFAKTTEFSLSVTTGTTKGDIFWCCCASSHTDINPSNDAMRIYCVGRAEPVHIIGNYGCNFSSTVREGCTKIGVCGDDT
jgi:hypothetical protein